MPRTLKRRSDAISREDDNSDATPGPSTRTTNTRRRRSSSLSSVANVSSAGSDDEAGTQGTAQAVNIENLSKKLVRLALSSEYARNPLRRTDIAQKIFKESNASPRLFKSVFSAAQKQLNDVFGMKMMELPSREKTTLKDRRTQATQTASATKSQSWVLVSTLAQEYKTHPAISRPTLAPSQDVEASYTGLYTFILSLIFLNNSSLPEAKMERYLKRVNADTYTPFGSLEKLLQKMVKDGYIDRRRDTTSGEEVVEFIPGPRGKVEIGINGVAGLVRSVYGFGSVGLDGKLANTYAHSTRGERGNPQGTNQDDEGANENGISNSSRPIVKIDQDDLEQRLKRSLGPGVVLKETTTIRNEPNTANADAMEVDETSDHQQPGPQPRNGRPAARNRTRRRGDSDDEDDEENNNEHENNDSDED